MATRPKKAKVVHAPPTRVVPPGPFAEKLRAIVDLGEFDTTYETKRYSTHRGAVRAASRLRTRAAKLPGGVRWVWTTGEDPNTGEGILYVTMEAR